MISHVAEDPEAHKICDTDFNDPAILSRHKPFQQRRTTIIVTFGNLLLLIN